MPLSVQNMHTTRAFHDKATCSLHYTVAIQLNFNADTNIKKNIMQTETYSLKTSLHYTVETIVKLC